MNKVTSHKFKRFLLLLPVFVGIYFLNNNSIAQSPDAIAIRIEQNPNHYSPTRWYRENIKIQGSPQALFVDGYEAVRDGRTVYVNAANIANNNFYTNIYIISYNQDAQNNTLDIFGQILNNWKFNINIQETSSCNVTSTTSCVNDKDCPENEYCFSTKARLVRDVKRLSDIADVGTSLNNYKKSKGYYPKLTAGSYLSNISLSVWPSWGETLSRDLNIGLPLDPINKLGSCLGFDTKTCWNPQTKKFATNIAAKTLPNQSRAYLYTTNKSGSEVNFCALLESSYANLTSMSCFNNSVANNPPVIKCGSLIGRPHVEFSGFVEATDKDGDSLSWNLDTSIADWSSWSSAPVLKSSPNANQKKIFSTAAGNSGPYKFLVSVTDSKTTTQKECLINIGSSYPPSISIIDNPILIASSTKAINVDIAEATDFIALFPLTTSLTPQLISGLSPTSVTNDNVLNFSLSGILGITNVFNMAETVFNYVLRVTDAYGIFADSSFFIKVLNTAPNINPISCANEAGLNKPFSCTITAVDPDGNSIKSFIVQGLPAGINNSAANGSLTLSGSPTQEGTFNISIKAVDEFGLEGVAKNYTLVVAISPECGDLIVNGDDVCDGNPLPCTLTPEQIAAAGVPSYCNNIPGRQNCKPDCTGWEEACSAPMSSIVDGTSTACFATNKYETGAACCQLISCYQDGCNCCGGGQAGTMTGWTVVQSGDVRWRGSGACGVLSARVYPNNACRLSRSDENLLNWYISTNHSTATYRCWR